MDAEQGKDGGFLGNIRQTLTGLLIGLLPLLTLVPLVANNINKITGFGLRCSFLIFIFGYFLLPVIFVVVWAYYHFSRRVYLPDGSGVLKFRLFWRVVTEAGFSGVATWILILLLSVSCLFLVLTLAAFFYYQSQSLTEIFFGGVLVMVAIAFVLFGFCLIRYVEVRNACKRAVTGDVEKQQEFLERLKGNLLQYVAFAFVVSFFMYLPARKTTDKNSPEISFAKTDSAFKAIEYADTLAKAALRTDSFQKKLEINYLLADVSNKHDSGARGSFRLYRDSVNEEIEKLDVWYDKMNTELAKTQVDPEMRQVLKGPAQREIFGRIDTLIRHLFEHCPDSSAKFIGLTISRLRYLSLISASINDNYQARVKKRWANILAAVQGKGLMLFFLTLLLLISCWFLSVMADIFHEHQFKPVNARINVVARPLAVRRGYYEVVEKTEYKTFPAIQMLKWAIILLALFIIPVYKPVDPEKVSLDKPFLDLSLDDVYKGGEGGWVERETPIYSYDTTKIVPMVTVVHDTVTRDTIAVKNYTLKFDTSSRVIYNLPKIYVDRMKFDDTLLKQIHELTIGIDTTTRHGSRIKHEND